MACVVFRLALRRALVGVPIAFQIGDQRRAEMARGLLACIDRHVTAKHIERLLGNAKGSPIAGGADHTRTGEAVDHLLQRSIDRRRRRDLIADETPFRRVAIDAPPVKDRLARDTIPGETPQPPIGGPREDAFLAARARY